MKKILLIFIGFYLTLSVINSQTLAFPGAEGYGKYTTGGRGGKVIYVTNLNDAGKGSLRAAIKDSVPRTIVFAVSGTIYLQKDLEIKHGNVTIAGQTAPGDGICIAGHSFSVETDNVIIRFLRFRMGDTNAEQGDAFGTIGCKNIIVDHCSISWSTDECASLYKNRNLTFQWNIVSESLYESIHKKGSHGFGGIWGGADVTFHHNLLAHHTSRNPRFNGTRLGQTFTEKVDYRNNVLYNWGYNSAYGGEKGQINMVANYYKPGPATQVKKNHRIVDISSEKSLAYGKYFVAENIVEGNKTVSDDNWNGGVNSEAIVDSVKAVQPFPFEPINQHSASEAFKLVLEKAGASLVRDSVDLRIIHETKTGTATYGATFGGGKKGIIDSQSEVGGWPVLKSLPAPADTDKDGMPDEWEKDHNLNPEDPADGISFIKGSEFTNFELYLNHIVKGIIN